MAPENDRDLAEGIAGGLIGGILASGLITATAVTGLMRIRAPTGRKEIIAKRTISEPTTLVEARYSFAIVLFHGDGDQTVELAVALNETQSTLRGNEQAIELVVGETLKVVASGSGATPTIEIASIAW